jgi:hypothetical protein
MSIRPTDNSWPSEEGKTLASMSRKNNFSVPADYFERLPEKTMARIHAMEKEPKKYPSFLKPVVAISSLAVFCCLVYFILFFNKGQNDSGQLLLLSDNDILQVMDYPQLYDIDDACITEHYLSSSKQDELLNTELEVSEAEVRIYLEDNQDIKKIINDY